jgi:hypothetical protein
VNRLFHVLAALCALASTAQAGHKIQTSDPAEARAILAAGGRLIADYGGFKLFDAAQTNGMQTRDSYNFILLNAARLDTSRPEAQALRRPVANFAGKRLHLVQFAGPVRPEWRGVLLDMGVRIVNYIPHNAYLIYGDAAALARVQAWAAGGPVQWDGPYDDSWKGPRTGGTNLFALQLVDDAEANAGTLALLKPAAPPRHVLDFVNVAARLTPAELKRLAARPDVISIQPWRAARKLDERQDQIVAGNISGSAPVGPGYLAWLAAKGFAQAQFDTSGFIVDVADSGIDNGTTAPNHFGFYSEGSTNAASRVDYVRLVGTPNYGSTSNGCDGHGAINAHIAAGYDGGAGFPFVDGSGYHYGLGVCPFAHLGSSVVFDPNDWTNPDFTQLESEAYESGARIENDSWGFNDPGGSYGIASQEFDALVRDAQPASSDFPTPGNQEMVIVFADGDSGPGAQTVLEPGTAKNVIDVGGADNVQPFNGADGCNAGDNEAESANELASVSSRGPCADGRHKPDLVAPCTHITGGVAQAPDPGPLGTADLCYNGSGICGGVGSIFYPPGQQFYTASSGTSHSAPCVAGGCALLRQYFINHSFLPPSPAMTKACLMNCARYLTGSTANDTLWSNGQGMGELNLGAAFDGAPRILRDEMPGDTFTASGQARVFTGFVAQTNLPFRVTVAWTDAPGSTTGSAANNDLDLTVAAGGITYLGNVFSGAWSVPGGSADELNNVESVFLPAGTPGAFTITVAAASINSIGVPNGSNGLTQDFALVVDNGVGAGLPVVAAAGAALAAENCLPANGAIDPDETVTVNFALQNSGTVNTSNLAATLQSGGGITPLSGPAVYEALSAGGAPVSRPFTFTASGVCGGTITAALQLQDGATNLGSAEFTFQLGQFIPANALAQSFDGVTAPALPSDWTSSAEGGQNLWITSSNLAGTPPNSAFAEASASAGVADLYSPVFSIATAAARLTFQSDYDLEFNPYSPAEAFDGAALEARIGTNAFTDILAAGGSFANNGYNKTIAPSGSDDNPLPGRACWSGSSGGFVTTVVNLPAAASGQSVQLRWRCATDTANSYASVGWWIDAVSITDGGSYICCGGPLDPLILNPHLDGTNFVFSFQTQNGQSYMVQFAGQLGGPWAGLQMLAGDGSIHAVTNSLGSAQGYYRLRGF